MYLQKDQARETELFSFDWEFRHGNIEGDVWLTEGFQPVQLPHDWSVSFPFDEHADTCGSGGFVTAGVGWYRKRFTVSPKAEGKQIFLQFDGAYMHTEVWLNGSYLGLHVYGYTPFEYDVSKLLHYDRENELTVKVDNSRQPNSRWYSGSGITRDVWITAVNPVHVPTYGSYVTCVVSEAEAEVKAQIQLVSDRAHCGHKAKAVSVLMDQEGSVVSRVEKEITLDTEQNLIFKHMISHPHLWSDVDPYLYRAQWEILILDDIVDHYETVFGIRTIRFDPDQGFLLNGVRTKINGFCVHHDAGCLGAAVPKKVWESRLKTMKAMGANGLRCSHNPPDPALLDLCDQLGFLVMDEAFDEWEILKGKELGSNTHESRGYSEWFTDHHEQDIKTMLYRDRNHPSIVLWSIGNEIPEQTALQGHLLAEKLKGICYSIDPTRPITLANDQIEAEPKKAKEEFLDVLDVVGYNYTGRWRTRAETLYDDDKRRRPDRCIIGSENPSPGMKRGDYHLEPKPGRYNAPYYTMPMRVSRLLRYTMTHDYVAGDYMWTGIDYLGEAHWPDRSASCGVLDTCGFPKDTYYLYQSVWTQKPMIYAYPHWNLDVEQGTIIPVICYTNCDYAELFLNGKSYGKKASSYPDYGMTEIYGHFDEERYPATTDDLFLSWDVPYEPGVVEVIGYHQGQELCRYQMQTVKQPAKLKVSADCSVLKADRRDIAQLTIEVLDEDGNLVPNDSRRIQVSITGAADLIGLDNGNPASLDLFQGNEMNAFGGLLRAVLRNNGKRGKIFVQVNAEGLIPAVLELETSK